MNRTPEPKVLVIVLNWNGWRDTVECLESLQQLDYSDFRMVVVDNCSSDDSWNQIKAWADGRELFRSHRGASQRKKPIVVASYNKDEAEVGGTAVGEALLAGSSPDRSLALIQSGANRGFAGGCNIGLRYALKRGAEYCWLLNNDAVVDSKALSGMVALANSHANVGLVGSVLYDSHKPGSIQVYGGGSINWWSGTTRHLKEPGKGKLDYLTGASLLIRKSVVESVGLLDESYFFYWEDIDYSQRVSKAGWEMSVARGSRVWHKEGGTVSGGKLVKSLVSDQFMVRSMIVFFSKHGGVRWPLTVFLRLGGMAINRLRRKQLGRFGPLLKVAATTCREAMQGQARWPFQRIARRVPGVDKSD